MRTLGGFVLELTALLSMCLMLAILMGVPALWALLGAVILMDFGVILFLGRRFREPDEGGGTRQRARVRKPLRT